MGRNYSNTTAIVNDSDENTAITLLHITEHPCFYEHNRLDEIGYATRMHMKHSRRMASFEIAYSLCLDSVTPLREMCCLLASPFSHFALFAISECTADGTGLFGTEILGQVFAVLQKFTGSLALGLVVHCEDTGN